MSDSETSSNVDINYQTKDGNNLLSDTPTMPTIKKPQTTDTDYYFNMIANPNKVVDDKVESETSQIIKSSSSKSSSSSSSSSRKSDYSKPVYDKITLSPRNNHTETRHTESRNVKHTETRHREDNNSEKPSEVVVKQLTPQEIRMKKIELLRKLSELKSKGFHLTKDYDFSSSLEEMEYEYDLLKSFVDKRNGVKLFKNGIVNVAAFIEFMNDKYDPFDFHLSGWSEHMDTEVDNWEDVLGELYEKYKGNGKKTPPELKLLGLVLFSASAFHFTKSHSMAIPFGNDMVKKMMAGGNTKETSQFMTPQEINLEKQAEMLKKKEMESKMKAQQEQQNYIKQLEEQVKRMQMSQQEPQPVNVSTNKLPNSIPVEQLRPTKTPTEVKDILNRLHNFPKIDKPANTETQDDTSSNNDRLLSESNVSESTPNKRGRKPKKSNISIF